MRVIGLMSGTSADGVDAALVEIAAGPPLALKHLYSSLWPYPTELRQRILQLATPPGGSATDVCRLNAYLGELFAQAALDLCRRARVAPESVDLIGSHGQTIRHLPVPRKEGELQVASTLQIGEPAVIAERTGITTVGNFRPRDVAAGGQGAPLTPLAHFVMFRGGKKGRAVLNVGGIANVTAIPAGGGLAQVMAFDTGPGNMLLDLAAHKLTRGQTDYDANGELAAPGRVSEDALRSLLAHPFIKKPPPKSTGREDFGPGFLDELMRKEHSLSPADLMATLAAFTAEAVALNLREFVLPKMALDEVALTGGGARNPVLRKMLAERLAPAAVVDPDALGFPGRAIEAMAFAFLAYLTWHWRPGNLPGATGAGRQVVLGAIVPGRTRPGAGAPAAAAPGVPSKT
jgi:anhydro-N-acetylmuramic acid kinase